MGETRRGFLKQMVFAAAAVMFPFNRPNDPSSSYGIATYGVATYSGPHRKKRP